MASESNDPRNSGHDAATSIFGAALEQLPADREAYLSVACGDDANLLAEVRALLTAHEAAPSQFLDLPGMETTIDGNGVRRASENSPQGQGGSDSEPVAELPVFVPPEQESDRIGRYKLLQEIGEGGFGTVWMAEQVEPVRRRVALKIIKLGMDTREIIARFEAERQAVAMMDHPHIAKVFDAGATDTGRPYFVMELVKGIPITKFCDERRMGTRERLELFEDVCSAINHAHQKGVIHRDIKPNNVMVTLHGDKPVVKVIDFGIAKATESRLTDKTLFTRYEQFIGTPVYMSPEQASLSGLDVDTRSDIYALGILLYELLTGKPPFDSRTLASAGLDEMLRIIREDEPPKPSSRLSTVTGNERTRLAEARQVEPEKLNRTVAIDLDWIVMKAIDKDRARRYETANGLAQDIERFLTDEPVSATPPSASYRFRKFARRNRTAFKAGVAVVAVLVAGIAISMWQAWRATKAENLAQTRLAEVEIERDAKDQALQDAEEISEFLANIFRSPDPNRDGRAVTAAEMLGTATKNLDSELNEQPARRAKLQATLGNTYRLLGLPSEAIPLQEKVRDFYIATFGHEHVSSLDAMNNLAYSYYEAGRREEALKLRKEADILASKVTFNLENPDHRSIYLEARVGLLQSSDDAGDEDTQFSDKFLDEIRTVDAEKLKLARERLALCRKDFGLQSSDTLIAMSQLAMELSPGHASVSFDGIKEALELREEVFSLRTKVSGSDHPETLSAMQYLALSYQLANRHEDALNLRERLLALQRENLGQNHPDTLCSMIYMASSYATADRREEALKMEEEILEFRSKMLDPEHEGVRNAISELAGSYSAISQQSQEEEKLRICRKIFGEEHPETLRAMQGATRSYRYGDHRDADQEANMQAKVLTLVRKDFGSSHPKTLKEMANLASIFSTTGRIDQAIEIQEELLELRRQAIGADHPDTLEAIRKLAEFYSASDHIEEARELLEKVLPRMQKIRGPKHHETLATMGELAKVYLASDQNLKAFELLERLLPLLPKSKNSEQISLLHETITFAYTYLTKAQPEEASAFQEKFPKILDLHVANLVGAENLALAEKHHNGGNIDEAIRLKENELRKMSHLFGSEIPLTLIWMRSLALSYAFDERPVKAIKLGEELRPLYLKKFGPEAPVTLKWQHKLAELYFGAGRHEDALQLLEEILPHCRNVFGPEHPTTLSAMHELAKSYAATGFFNKALPMQKEVTSLMLGTKGLEDRQTLLAMHELAKSYVATGSRYKALAIQEELLPLFQRISEPESPETLAAMHELAESYTYADKLNEAKALQQEVMNLILKVICSDSQLDKKNETNNFSTTKAISLCRQVLGADHPDTFTVLKHLANSERPAGSRSEVTQLQKEILRLSRKLLGQEHLDTLHAMNNLANSYDSLVQNSEALNLRSEVLSLRRKVLGEEHSDTLAAMTNLAISYRISDRLDEALSLQEQALSIKRRMLPQDHPFLFVAMDNLAACYFTAGRIEDSLNLKEEKLSLARKAFGPNHAKTFTAMEDLVKHYTDTGQSEKTISMKEEALVIRRKLLGPDHPDLYGPIKELKDSYLKDNRIREAISLQEEMLTLVRNTSGATHRSTLNSRTELAIAYRLGRRIDDAIALELETLSLKREHLWPNDPPILESMENLAFCYEQSNQSAEADAIHREIAKFKLQ